MNCKISSFPITCFNVVGGLYCVEVHGAVIDDVGIYYDNHGFPCPTDLKTGASLWNYAYEQSLSLYGGNNYLRAYKALCDSGTLVKKANTRIDKMQEAALKVIEKYKRKLDNGAYLENENSTKVKEKE